MEFHIFVSYTRINKWLCSLDLRKFTVFMVKKYNNYIANGAVGNIYTTSYSRSTCGGFRRYRHTRGGTVRQQTTHANRDHHLS